MTHVTSMLTIAFPLVLLNSVHAVLTTCPIPHLSPALLPRYIFALLEIASPPNLVKLLRHGSASGTPRTDDDQPSTSTPSGTVMLVSEIVNVFLTTALLPQIQPDQSAFASPFGLAESTNPVPAEQTRKLLEKKVTADPSQLLSSSDQGLHALKDAEAAGARWLSELIDPDLLHEYAGSRRSSLFSITGVVDEEVELTVTVLYLLNTLSLHRSELDSSHLDRLRLVLSEESTATDPRVLEAAFICSAVVVRKSVPPTLSSDCPLLTSATHPLVLP